MFESSVNSDSIQTKMIKCGLCEGFESSVNSDSIQTKRKINHYSD